MLHLRATILQAKRRVPSCSCLSNDFYENCIGGKKRVEADLKKYVETIGVDVLRLPSLLGNLPHARIIVPMTNVNCGVEDSPAARCVSPAFWHPITGCYRDALA